MDNHIKEGTIKMSEKNIIIRPETKDDYRAVENLTRESFWNVYRPGCMEHYVLHCYRDDPAFVPELDFVMELDGELIGQVIYVRSEIDCDDGRKVPIMTFGPIGIAPAYKRQGYGKKLLDYSMEKAKEMLEQTHNKIVNISYAVGYPNVSYFCQSFREYYGVSPQKYRNQ